MRDYTLTAYQKYIEIILKNYNDILRFDEYFRLNKPLKSFVIFRHDVDRHPNRALKMANLENQLGIKSTYYFRMKNHTFIPNIILKISEMGHEIGYHYECLSDADGDLEKALVDFKINLDRLRKIVPVNTISMHGRPFSKYDNRDMWDSIKNKKILKNEFKLLGEVYLDIDYSDIAYINDTGRNWFSNKANIRDKINSNINSDFDNKDHLFVALNEKHFRKIIFQIHPERWNENYLKWMNQYLFDTSVNFVKKLL